ncbi:hypothetical protein CC1G_08081 [Coprinopsis cinerea okayama7|uniref:Uncharacterized protein n=1 Tax=Coprinopsis cinerea (strain Okayama-7 / 130 / ATCC MYA-4618 / FGSC 9003) TaxID=240176 RepID=A8NVP3_COPC7|nr:hypothetical protein CC1G_08081 [Coprinopsis cinerea okayama7\|eukprot:XP_001836696.2 hypothetical protein CC1G_08081 [Coprinopsis cinerea okayama7\
MAHDFKLEREGRGRRAVSDSSDLVCFNYKDVRMTSMTNEHNTYDPTIPPRAWWPSSSTIGALRDKRPEPAARYIRSEIDAGLVRVHCALGCVVPSSHAPGCNEYDFDCIVATTTAYNSTAWRLFMIVSLNKGCSNGPLPPGGQIWTPQPVNLPPSSTRVATLGPGSSCSQSGSAPAPLERQQRVPPPGSPIRKTDWSPSKHRTRRRCRSVL